MSKFILSWQKIITIIKKLNENIQESISRKKKKKKTRGYVKLEEFGPLKFQWFSWRKETDTKNSTSDCQDEWEEMVLLVFLS